MSSAPASPLAEPAAVARLPRTPWPLRALNSGAHSLGGPARLVPLEVDRMLARAERATGLSTQAPGAWGPAWAGEVREALTVLLRSFNEDAGLNFGGRLVVRNYLHRLLCNRLRVERDIAAHPDIEAVAIKRPVFIVGLPRTGSTLLQRLMARDPQVRSLATWEMMFPSPPPEQATYASDPRIAATAWRLKLLLWAAPDFVAAHELAVGEPEECVGLLQTSLVTNAFELMTELRGYRDWYRQQDPRLAYRYYRRQLQHLQWRMPRDHWVLKCPVHLFGLDALLQEFPDAVIVQTHRSPVAVMPSVCSLFSVVQVLLCEQADTHELAADWLQRWAQACDEAIALRERHPQARFVDVSYKALVEDPWTTLRRLYVDAGHDLGDEALRAMQAWRDANPQHKHGTHRYTLEQFGLDADQVRARFAGYIERFAPLL